jgi:hypothetical protein
MTESILKYIIYLLAVYGAITLILSILGTVHGRMAAEATKVRPVLFVKNVEEYVEYIIRNAIKFDFPEKVMSGDNLTVVDMNSTDDTFIILQKLKKDYECIDILSAGEKEDIFSDFFKEASGPSCLFSLDKN